MTSLVFSCAVDAYGDFGFVFNDVLDGFLVEHAPVSYDACVQAQTGGVVENFKEVLAQKRLSTCDAKEACAEIMDLINDFHGAFGVYFVWKSSFSS